jgi:hypothetical protein
MRVFSVCLVMTLAGCGAGLNDSGGSGATGEEDPGVAGIVAAHNAARAAVQPAPAAPLAPLTWSAAAFEQARAWAARCQWGHNPTRGAFGENLFATSGDTTSQAVVDTWVSEKSDYDYAANSCSATCGHYTQVVWYGAPRPAWAARREPARAAPRSAAGAGSSGYATTRRPGTPADGPTNGAKSSHAPRSAP